MSVYEMSVDFLFINFETTDMHHYVPVFFN